MEHKTMIYIFFAANTVVQQFLSMIASGMGISNADMDAKKMLIPLPHLSEVLKQLLNPYVTELDCTLFDKVTCNAKKYNNLLLKHALKNCPKISKIYVANPKSAVYLPPEQVTDQLPVERFKQSWDNLKSINISRHDYICDENTLKLIQENCPNIESVAFLLPP